MVDGGTVGPVRSPESRDYLPIALAVQLLGGRGSGFGWSSSWNPSLIVGLRV